MNTDNTFMDMDPELAKELFSKGAILVIAGVPVTTEFGIDLCTYTVGDRFRGIKMIPPGPHYVYCAAQSPYGDSGCRVGFLHYFKPFEILIREWDPNTEELRQRNISDPETEKRRIRENLKDLDRFLGAYDYRYIEKWRKLTDSVTEDGVERCSPGCGVVRTNIELMSCPDSERPRGKTSSNVNIAARGVVDEDDLLPNLKPIPGTAPRFTDLPSKVPLEATPSEISRHHMDCIDAVDKIMEKFSNAIDLIEEIQIAFIMFLVGHSVESLGHWRKLLNLLCNSEEAIEKHQLFYMKYLEVLIYQLPHLPEELLEQNEKNTVYKDVRKLVLNSFLGGLSVNADKLIKSLNKSMRWKFPKLLDEDPEDMPVVVETE